MQFVPNHDDLLIAGINLGDVTICDLSDDSNSISFKSSQDVTSVAIAPNAKQFIAGSGLDVTNIWDLEQFLENRKAKLQPAARSCTLQ